MAQNFRRTQFLRTTSAGPHFPVSVSIIYDPLVLRVLGSLPICDGSVRVGSDSRSYNHHSGTKVETPAANITVGLQISVRECGDISILDLQGRSTIDGESELLGIHLKKLIDNGVRKLLLNLAELTQIDSSGIAIVVSTCVSLRQMGGDLRLLRPSGRVLQVLTVCHLLNVIPSFENEAQATASFRPRGYFATS